MRVLTKLAVGLCGIALSLAVLANTVTINAAPGSVGNPVGSTGNTRASEAYSALVNYMGAGMTILPGDVVVVVYGDGWTQEYDISADQYGNKVIAPRSSPQPGSTYAGGGGGGGTGACSGSYRPVYGTAIVRVNGETVSEEAYISGYEWTGSC